MKINMTFEFDDEDRFAINARFGAKHRADRETLEAEIRSLVDTHVQDAVMDYRMAEQADNDYYEANPE